MSRLVVWSQLGPEAGRAISAALPDVEPVEIPLAPESSPAMPSKILIARPRRDLAPDELATVDTSWASGVEWVHSISTGIDGYPPSLLAGRTVTVARGVPSVNIAEFVLAAALSAVKHIPAIWQPGTDVGRKAGKLHGATLGIVGFGTIGQAIARRALPFGMRVLAVRRTDQPSPLPEVELVPLAALLGRSDHVVLALPLTAATRRLLNAESLALLKPGAHLINVARGGHIDQEALLAALDDGRVGLATLDVTEPEPLPDGHPLLARPRVRISDHVAGYSPTVGAEILANVVENLRRHLAGEPLLGGVNPIAGY